MKEKQFAEIVYMYTCLSEEDQDSFIKDNPWFKDVASKIIVINK